MSRGPSSTRTRHALHLILRALPAHGVVLNRPASRGGPPRPVGPSRSEAASSTPALCMATGRTITWMGAILGGRTRPLLSPCAMMTAPIMRVVEPQDVWNGYCKLVVAAGEGHVVGAGELVAEIVGGRALKRLVILHHALDGVGRLGARKLLLFGLAAGYNGNGEDSSQRNRHSTSSMLLGLVPSPPRRSHGWCGPPATRTRWLRRNGRVVFSQRMTEHHWLYSIGSSR